MAKGYVAVNEQGLYASLKDLSWMSGKTVFWTNDIDAAHIFVGKMFKHSGIRNPDESQVFEWLLAESTRRVVLLDNDNG